MTKPPPNLLVDTRHLHIGGIVGDVHQGGIDHLVIHGVLGTFTHTASSSIQVVNEQRRHLTLANHVSSLTVTLADKLGGLTSVTGFQLT